jgi:hypothetical protein
MVRRVALGALVVAFAFALAGWTNQYQKCSKDGECNGGETCEYGYCVRQ